ncbi:MAG: hypothetical protein M1834_000143 [Cirrosporium novae-zelandiae]|nr:MAG: hypothetical protein M1834_000143 [Cirrosporium novae-zelandiae]
MAAIAAGGAYFAHKGFLTPEASRAFSMVILNFLLPCLIFNTVIPSFTGNMDSALLLLITGFFYQSEDTPFMGLVFGFIVRWFTPVPPTWKGGVLATGLFNNWGDLVIAYITSIGNSKPFSGETDIDHGEAYASLFMVVQMVSLFNLGGLQLIRSDFTHKKETDVEDQKHTSIVKSTASAVVNHARRTTDLVSRGISNVRRRSSVQSGPRPNAYQLRQLTSDGAPTVINRLNEVNKDSNGTALATSTSGPNSAWKNIHNQSPSPVFENDEYLTTRELSESQAQTAVNSRVPSHHVPSIREPSVKESSSQTPVNSRVPSHHAPSIREPSIKESSSQEESIPPKPTKKTIPQRLWSLIKPLCTPPSLSMISAIIIANVPQLTALFTTTSKASMPNAPDGKPPLDFIMDISDFGGQSVPVIGMILLGGALSRLSIRDVPKGFWISTLSMSILKLIIGAIIGLVWTTQVATKTGLLDKSNLMLQFVMIISAGVPSATTQIYLTNIFAPVGGEKCTEISALSM